MDDFDKQIKQLTDDLLSKCGGKNGAVVIGAAMNVIQTAINYSNNDLKDQTAGYLKVFATNLEQSKNNASKLN